jgi:hypothetical protein
MHNPRARVRSPAPDVLFLFTPQATGLLSAWLFLEVTMESAELEASGGLADESARVVGTVDPSAAPNRMPSGTIAPPIGATSEDEGDLDALRARAQVQRSTQAWHELAPTIRRLIEIGEIQGVPG